MALQAKVLFPDVVDYPFARFEEELARSMNRQSSETVAARRQLQKIEAEIRNCTRAIASEGLSSFLRTRLAPVALAATRVMASLLFGVGAADPLTFGVVTALLMIVTLLAVYLPARRAMRADPMVALRYE